MSLRQNGFKKMSLRDGFDLLVLLYAPSLLVYEIVRSPHLTLIQWRACMSKITGEYNQPGILHILMALWRITSMPRVHSVEQHATRLISRFCLSLIQALSELVYIWKVFFEPTFHVCAVIKPR